MVFEEEKPIQGIIPSYQGKKRGNKPYVSHMCYKIGKKKKQKKKLSEVKFENE